MGPSQDSQHLILVTACARTCRSPECENRSFQAMRNIKFIIHSPLTNIDKTFCFPPSLCNVATSWPELAREAGLSLVESDHVTWILASDWSAGRAPLVIKSRIISSHCISRPGSVAVG